MHCFLHNFLSFVLGDRNRVLFLFITTFLLIILGTYSYTVNSNKQNQFFRSINLCISKLLECPDKTITLSAQIKELNQNIFVVNIRTKTGSRWEDLFEREYDITVLGTGHELSSNDVIVLKGRLLANRTMTLERYETEGKWVRETKYGISLLAFCLTIVILLQTFRFSLKRFMFVRKEN